jgi:hypothetical protein
VKNHPLSVRFSEPERTWLEQQSVRRGVAVSEVVRESIRKEMLNVVSTDRLDAIDSRLAEMHSVMGRDFEALGKIAMKTLKLMEASK